MKEICLAIACLYTLLLGGSNTTKEKTELVIMSYNIRHCAPYYGTSRTTVANVSGIAEVIREKQPDVALLQEVDWPNWTNSREFRSYSEEISIPNRMTPLLLLSAIMGLCGQTVTRQSSPYHPMLLIGNLTI